MQPAATPAEAVSEVLKKRVPVSARIDYVALNKLFTDAAQEPVKLVSIKQPVDMGGDSHPGPVLTEENYDDYQEEY